jgi:hypothetical protein
MEENNLLSAASDTFSEEASEKKEKGKKKKIDQVVNTIKKKMNYFILKNPPRHKQNSLASFSDLQLEKVNLNEKIFTSFNKFELRLCEKWKMGFALFAKGMFFFKVCI